MERVGNDLGLRVASEAFVDRLYDDDGNLASRKIPGTVITDPAVASQRTVMMVREQVVLSTSRKLLPRRIDTLCVHGDEPTAYAVASETRRALEAAGVHLVPLPELIP